MGAETAIAAIVTLATSLLAPEVVKALLGGQSVEEAIAAARAAQDKIPVLEDAGEWDADLAERKQRG